MAFPAIGATPTEKPLGAARDAIPITASTSNNWRGNAFTSTGGGDANACRAILASGTATFSGIMATGQTRSNVIIQAGVTPLQVIQFTAIAGGTLWGLI